MVMIAAQKIPVENGQQWPQLVQLRLTTAQEELQIALVLREDGSAVLDAAGPTGGTYNLGLSENWTTVAT